jgi:hypothetical protein
VHVGDAAWEPLIDLIQKYSKTKLRADKTPQTVARLRATLDTQQELGDGARSEWTSPSTPFVVFYRYWPGNTGKTIPPEDFTIVGTIGDLQGWIADSKADCHFLIHDIVLGVLALALGYGVWHVSHLYRDPA